MLGSLSVLGENKPKPNQNETPPHSPTPPPHYDPAVEVCFFWRCIGLLP